MTETLPRLALSVRQPWAWAIIHAGKDIENRKQIAISKGGMGPARIAVHASKGMTRDEYEGARAFMERIGVKDIPRPDALKRGGVIGAVTVTAIVREHESPWFFGPRGLVLADAEPLDLLEGPCPGALGFFEWRGRAQETDWWEEPLPWMTAWPNERGKPKMVQEVLPLAPAPLPLFGED